MNNSLTIHNLYVVLASSKEEKQVLHGIDLIVPSGQLHVVMGPNGAGKTTLALSLMGHPNYKLSPPAGGSEFRIDGKDMIGLKPEERAKAGLFVSFQQPVEITGVSVLAFLRTAYKALHPEEKIPLSDFKNTVKEALIAVELGEQFMQRSVNEGFSGGEKKRLEIVQLLILKPKFAILDEIDSGLDIDSLKIIAKILGVAAKKYNMGILLITHYQRILHLLHPDAVHVLVNGKIKRSGGTELVEQIEKEGYATI